jgi:hypothetical protein
VPELACQIVKASRLDMLRRAYKMLDAFRPEMPRVFGVGKGVRVVRAIALGEQLLPLAVNFQ